MDVVTILRRLWRLRFQVLLIGCAAVMIGGLVSFQISFPPKTRTHTVGFASARILIDTPSSQVVEVAPKGSESLGARASVLANLMVDGEIKAAIARRAGLPPSRLVASAPTAGGEPAAGADAKAYTLTTAVVVNSDLSELPIIKVDAQAPTTAAAAKLANAAVTGLNDYLDSKAAAESVSDGRRLRVTGLGSALARDVTLGPGRLMGLVTAIFVFLCGCATLLLVSALISAWRQADADADAAESPAPTGPEISEPESEAWVPEPAAEEVAL